MNEKSTNLEILVKTAIEKIREVADTETVIGKPIVTSNGTTVIPVSKISIGFGSGGSDLPTKQAKDLFGGGAGGGVSIQPIAFITIMPDGNVKLLQMTINAPKENAALALIPDVVDKIAGQRMKQSYIAGIISKGKTPEEGTSSDEAAE